MANRRIDDFNEKFIYTDTNPEGIISAKKGAFFYRRDNDFYFNIDGNIEAGTRKRGGRMSKIYKCTE